MTGNVLEWVDEAHPQDPQYKFLRGGCWAESCKVMGTTFLHNIAARSDATGASSQKNIFGFRCARDQETPLEMPGDGAETGPSCPLCGGGWLPFSLSEMKIPDRNIYTWRGFFDIP